MRQRSGRLHQSVIYRNSRRTRSPSGNHSNSAPRAESTAPVDRSERRRPPVTLHVDLTAGASARRPQAESQQVAGSPLSLTSCGESPLVDSPLLESSSFEDSPTPDCPALKFPLEYPVPGELPSEDPPFEGSPADGGPPLGARAGDRQFGESGGPGENSPVVSAALPEDEQLAQLIFCYFGIQPFLQNAQVRLGSSPEQSPEQARRPSPEARIMPQPQHRSGTRGGRHVGASPRPPSDTRRNFERQPQSRRSSAQGATGGTGSQSESHPQQTWSGHSSRALSQQDGGDSFRSRGTNAEARPEGRSRGSQSEARGKGRGRAECGDRRALLPTPEASASDEQVAKLQADQLLTQQQPARQANRPTQRKPHQTQPTRRSANQATPAAAQYQPQTAPVQPRPQTLSHRQTIHAQQLASFATPPRPAALQLCPAPPHPVRHVNSAPVLRSLGAPGPEPPAPRTSYQAAAAAAFSGIDVTSRVQFPELAPVVRPPLPALASRARALAPPLPAYTRAPPPPVRRGAFQGSRSHGSLEVQLEQLTHPPPSNQRRHYSDRLPRHAAPASVGGGSASASKEVGKRTRDVMHMSADVTGALTRLDINSESLRRNASSGVSNYTEPSHRGATSAEVSQQDNSSNNSSDKENKAHATVTPQLSRGAKGQHTSVSTGRSLQEATDSTAAQKNSSASGSLENQSTSTPASQRRDLVPVAESTAAGRNMETAEAEELVEDSRQVTSKGRPAESGSRSASVRPAAMIAKADAGSKGNKAEANRRATEKVERKLAEELVSELLTEVVEVTAVDAYLSVARSEAPVVDCCPGGAEHLDSYDPVLAEERRPGYDRNWAQAHAEQFLEKYNMFRDWEYVPREVANFELRGEPYTKYSMDRCNAIAPEDGVTVTICRREGGVFHYIPAQRMVK